MLFTVSQISPAVELVFADAEKFINVYPAYHQNGDLIYCTVSPAAWTLVGTEYRWETTFPAITSTTVPVIQLIYSYNSTQSQRQQEYSAFKSITSVETVEGKLYLRAPIRPSTSFRIRYRRLDRLDLAIPLNRYLGVGIGAGLKSDSIDLSMTAMNPMNSQSLLLTTRLPEASVEYAGVMSSDLVGRLLKLEDMYNQGFNQPYRIDGYASAGASTPISTYYADITSVQSVSQDTWYKECSVYSTTDAADFTTAAHLFYQQQATVLDLTHIYTGNVETFSYALAANALLQSIKGLQLLDTRKVTDISYMFSDDVALESVDLGSCDMSSVTNIEGLFKGCVSLNYLDVRSIDFTKTDRNGTALIEQADVFTGVLDNCVIWVGGETQYNAIHAVYPNLTGITYN